MGAPFVWYDVATTSADAETVREFYGSLLGWAIGPNAEPGPYRGWIMDGDQPWASIVEAGDRSTSGRWIPYVQVDDLDVAVDKATALGATVVTGKADGPAGTAVTVADPGGALVALWTPFPEGRASP
jgi:predicted enzyme related to lactoylglutathione lyase